MKKHISEVIEVIRRTPASKSIRFRKPDGFGYEPGQYNIFTPLPDESDLSKPLSFSSSPSEPFLEVTKRISSSDYSAVMDRVVKGSGVAFAGPAGQLTYRGGNGPVVFIAGGIGITPVRSILRYLEDTEVPEERVLFYANQCLEEIAFREELERMREENPLFELVHILQDPPKGWKGPTGFITPELIEGLVTDDEAARTIFLCGPPPMVSALESFLVELRVPREKIRKEQLLGYETLV
ncbi:MAG: hypothetical protein GXP52_05205 [Deltaproteobacteria bacterium]|nr:hypothetical protein [Deltaproteobacteria bacterium]